MDEMQKYTGKWWLPNNPRKKLSGTLEIDIYGKAQLIIDGSFFIPRKPKDQFESIILGRTNQGDVTLYKNYFAGSGGRIEGYKFSKYECQFIVDGAHFRTFNSESFTKITLSYSNLYEWLNKRKSAISSSKDLLVTYDLTPQEFNIQIDEDINLQFLIFVTQSGTPLNPIKETITERVNLIVLFNSEKKFDEILAIESKIKNFLRFVMTSNTQLTSFYLEKPGKRSKKYVLPYEVIQVRKRGKEYDLSWFEMLFTYKDLEDNMVEIMKNWFSKYEELLPVYSLYFNAFYSDTTVLEQSFLSAIQALEAYHRRTHSNNILPKLDHEERVVQILEATPLKYKDWLESILMFSNEPFLQNRINDILSDFEEITQVLIADPDFSKKVKNYRHRFTHYDPKKTKKPIDYDDLFKQWHKLRMLLDACILKELGLPLDQVTAIIRKKYVRMMNYIN